MTKENNPQLTSTEVAFLWTSYMRESMTYCFTRYFLEKVNDQEIEKIIDQVFTLSQKRIFDLSQILNKEEIPAPQGFGEDDVNIGAPRLYTDNFFIYNLLHIAKVQINVFSRFFSECTRSDIRHFFEKCIASTTSIYNKTVNVLLSKGLYIRPNFVVINDEAEFMKDKKTIRDLFGRNRKMTTLELAHIYANLQNNAFKRSLITGFAQVAKSKQVRYFLSKGREISSKHIKVFNSILQDDERLAPGSWDMESTGCTTSPFSDKLMMYKTAFMSAAGFVNYAESLASTMREDVQNVYMRFMGELAMYSKESTKIMLDNQWLEQAPKPIDHKVLINV